MTCSKKTLKSIINKFQKNKILIIGDLILDEYIWGTVHRISPEAPVPVVEVNKQSYSAGGASYVASLISYLGGKAVVVGVVGKDHFGNELTGLLNQLGIITDGVYEDDTRPTTLKTRVIAHRQQIVRIDNERQESISTNVINELLSYVKKHIKEMDAVIISDYSKGVLIPEFFNEVIKLSKSYKKLITVDPKPAYCLAYKGVSVITPNTAEAASSIGIPINDEKTLGIAGKKLLEKLKCDNVLITRGEAGMSLFKRNGKIIHIPTVAREVFDVSGAGDAVISSLTMAMASGANIEEAAHISNYAAGVEVGKLGTAKVTRKEVIDAIDGK